ncbi:TatD family hydrolase [Aquimarina sp. W85]|uniref:TatD family hydrolase n=1 Tax=Aquimarina rhodophyticola TaxID=3342246 RepID=UPI00366E6B39
MILTDTHTHIYSESFEEDRNVMMQRAIDKGVQRFFVPAIDSTYTKAMLEVERSFPGNVFLMAGLHPTYVKENFLDELAHVKNALITHDKSNEKATYYAVGEIGIDLYWDTTFLKQQQEAFRAQIKMAKQFDLPIVIHCRDAFNEVFEILEEEKSHDLRGIFHCFTGTLAQAEQAIALNLKLGIGGVVTFKNGKINKFLDQIELKHIVLETDAPYLAPVPYRGKRNESSYIVEVADCLSDIYKLSLEEIANQTTLNSKEVFGI